MQACTCRCGIDWLGLRQALGLTQSELCHLLAVHRTTLWRAERRPGEGHVCPHAGTIKLLRIWLREPELRERLRRAGYPSPWPEDADGEAPSRAAVG